MAHAKCYTDGSRASVIKTGLLAPSSIGTVAILMNMSMDAMISRRSLGGAATILTQLVSDGHISGLVPHWLMASQHVALIVLEVPRP